MKMHRLRLSVAAVVAIGIATEASAHKEQEHQYMCQQAYLLLKKSFPTQLTEMGNYLGTYEQSGCPYSGEETSLSWGKGLIASGAWYEDHEDVIYYYGSLKNPNYDQGSLPTNLMNLFGSAHEAHVSITHFWNADGGRNAPTSLNDRYYLASGGPWYYWSFTIPENAFQKIKKYEDMSNPLLDEFRVSAICVDPENSCTLSWLSARWQFPPLETIYQADPSTNSTMTWFLGNSSGNCSNPSCRYNGVYRWQAYEILGRMCHLLEDMSVPEHAHCDSHAKKGGMRSSWLEDNELSYHQWTADEIWNSGKKFINPFFFNGTDSDPLYNLMYILNQVADHYASASVNGNDNYDRNFRILSSIIPNCGAPTSVSQINDQNCRSMNDVLQPLTIRAVAGLMYWFACQTGQLQQTPSTDNNPNIVPIISVILQ